LTSPDKTDDALLQPKQLFFTASGRIGVVIDMSPEMSLHMTELQRNMAQVIVSTGGLSHTKSAFHSIHNEHANLNLDSEHQETVEDGQMRKYLRLASLTVIFSNDS
jgi:DNA damage-binding protein 1